MGSSSSKHNASSSVVRRSRSSGSRGLKSSSCLRSHGSDNDEPQASGCSNKENGKSVENNKSGAAQCRRTDKAEESNDVNCRNSSIDLHEWGESSFTNTASREGNTSTDFSSQSLNPPSRFLSRFSFYPGNLSFRLTRSNGLRSASRSYPASSTSFTIPNQEVEEEPEEEEEEEEECLSPCSSLGNRNQRSHSLGCDFFPACFTSRPSRTRGEHCASNSSPDNRILNSGHDILSNGNNPNLFSPLNHINSERRVADREPVERNVRFSRTLSVGRLRDRVHRRTPPSDLDLCHITGRRGLSHAEVEATSVDSNLSRQVSSDDVALTFANPVYGSQNNVYENPRARETRYRDLLEHRSNFLERRRRIRSQVRALQRLGSRFENLSGHERSCILSGQHRGGHCSCRSAARDPNSNDDSNARASISRIVMLAEALFEVLDEIHQQSVVLSSRPSVSSIGSVPAPNEAVDSLPLKIFSKSKRKQCDDTTAQCYICLVEYEDGDSVRILPCHHEFHRACVDKWLKEVHRVCPLCRRDICRPDSLTSTS